MAGVGVSVWATVCGPVVHVELPTQVGLPQQPGKLVFVLC